MSEHKTLVTQACELSVALCDSAVRYSTSTSTSTWLLSRVKEVTLSYRSWLVQQGTGHQLGGSSSEEYLRLPAIF